MGSLETAAADVSNMAGRNNAQRQQLQEKKKGGCSGGGGGGGSFRMPLHYPRYSKADYETMPEWKLDCLLQEYGLPVLGNLAEKRTFAVDAFLWA